MTAPKLRKAPLWVPVINGKVQFALGLFSTRKVAAHVAHCESLIGEVKEPAAVSRVWVAVERP